ncbi:MAG TPA: sulfatase-like hydrolase/transferase, partial [Polyangiales bacterium]
AALAPAPPEKALPARSREHCAGVLAPTRLPALELAPERRRNVIFISIDSVRADFVRRARPDGSVAMPAVARFMAESRAARPAHAAYPATLMSLASALTGAAPTDLLLAPDAYPTLFQLTSGRFDHVEVVLPSSRYFARPEVRTRLLSGAKVFSAGGATRQTRYARDLLQGLREQGKSHFVWLHYFDPHEPYDTHPPHDFGDSDPQRYLSELAYVDDTLQPLLELLRSEGWYDDSLIALFSDHGESFGERGHRYHHHLLYTWLLSVPFALHAPGLAPGLFEGPVQLTDLTPTVLQFLGVSPTRPSRGLPLLAADPAPDRALFSEEIPVNSRVLQELREQPLASEADVLARLRRIERGYGYVSKLAVTRSGYQLVQHRDSQAVELYDVAHDPRAERDLADAQPARRAALAAELAELRRDMLLRALCELPSAR